MVRVVAFVLTLCLVAAVGGVSPAQAELRYTSDKTSDGIRFIRIEGDFGFDDDLDQFAAAIRSYNPEAIVFNSAGGNVVKAMQMGRMIRSFKLATFQPRELECASACALAFLGGTTRFAQPGSIGVHKSSFADTTGMNVDDAVSAVQQLTADVISYMIEMGVDPALLQLSLKYDSDDMRYLSKSEMVQYRVVTEEDQQAAQPPNGPSEPVPPAPGERPVEVDRRKVVIHPIPGDRREVGWVYINVCSTAVIDDEAIRERVEARTFANMRLVAGQVAQFDPVLRSECAGSNVLKVYAHSRTATRNAPIVPAAAELLAALSAYDVKVDGTLGILSESTDDDFRFDVWLTALPGVAPQPAATSYPSLTIPEARTGRTLHASGSVPLKREPKGGSTNIARFRNGTTVKIAESIDRWYRVTVRGKTGYMHHTWIHVDQFDSGPFDRRHIQIKSFDNLAEAQDFVRSAPVPMAIYLATNGWFAIAFETTFERDNAVQMVRRLKLNGSIPDDAFVTNGNTYARKLCCD